MTGKGIKETRDEKFITLLDKEAFHTIAQELDTIPHFIEYLRKREGLFAAKKVTILPGNEEDFTADTANKFFEYVEQNCNPSEKQSILVSGTEHDVLAYYLMNERTFLEYIQSKEYNEMFVQLDGNWTDYNQSK